MDILPEPGRRDSTHSRGDDTTVAGAAELSHAAPGDDRQEDHETLCHLQVTAQLEAKTWAMPSGRCGHRETPSVEVMRAKVRIGLGVDFEHDMMPSRCHFHPPVLAPKLDEDEALEKNEGRKMAPFLGPPILILQKGWASFRPHFL